MGFVTATRSRKQSKQSPINSINIVLSSDGLPVDVAINKESPLEKIKRIGKEREREKQTKLAPMAWGFCH